MEALNHTRRSVGSQISGKILVLCGGSVSQCSVPHFIKHIVADPKQITILDFQDTPSKFTEAIQSGVRFVIDKVRSDDPWQFENFLLD